MSNLVLPLNNQRLLPVPTRTQSTSGIRNISSSAIWTAKSNSSAKLHPSMEGFERLLLGLFPRDKKALPFGLGPLVATDQSITAVQPVQTNHDKSGLSIIDLTESDWLYSTVLITVLLLQCYRLTVRQMYSIQFQIISDWLPRPDNGGEARRRQSRNFFALRFLVQFF